MKRIAIIGSTGSGKTTLGRQLGELFNIKATDLDDLHWRPGWQEAPREEFKREVRTTIAEDSWIVSGNYSKVKDEIWDKADTLIWLDYSFPFTFGRLLKRSFDRVKNDTVICNGNRETLGKLFSADSIIVWLFKSYWRRRKEYDEVFSDDEKYAHLNKVRLRGQKETDYFIEGLKNQP